jgi:FixJ family two-component response regulator
LSAPRGVGTPIVYIVDDDLSVRESLEALIEHEGWRPLAFASAGAFLAEVRRAVASCLVLDVGLPDLDGLELQKRLGSGSDLPIIFVTGRGDIPMTVRAMKAGAVEFLTKPFEPDVLVGAIRNALERSRVSLVQDASLQMLRTHYASLSPREQDVMALVVLGKLNKQVAAALGLSEITIKGHRGRMMRKMGAQSFAELVNMADRLGLETAGKS